MTERIEVPPIKPLPFGLLSVLQLDASSDPHWLMDGVDYEWVPGVTGVAQAPCTEAAEAEAKEPFATDYARDDSVTLYSAYECAMLTAKDEHQKLAVDNLVLGTSAGLEIALRQRLDDLTDEDGDGGVDDSRVTVVPTTTTPDVRTGIALLQDAFADAFAGQGIVHADIATSSLAFAHESFRIAGNHLETGVGHLAVAGVGYSRDTTVPAGVTLAATERLVFMTGPMVGRTTSAKVYGPAKNLVTNMQFTLAEQSFIFGWVGPAFAIKVTLA